MNFSTISNGFKTAGEFIAVKYNYVKSTRLACIVTSVANTVFSVAASLTMNHKGKLAAVAAFTAVVVKVSDSLIEALQKETERPFDSQNSLPNGTEWIELKKATEWTARKINTHSTALNRFAVGCATLSATGFVAKRLSN